MRLKRFLRRQGDHDKAISCVATSLSKPSHRFDHLLALNVCARLKQKLPLDLLPALAAAEEQEKLHKQNKRMAKAIIERQELLAQ